MKQKEMKQKGEKDTGSTGFSKLIRDLKNRTERCAKELKVLENIGTEDAAQNALWIVYGVWNGSEYKAIENKLRNRGYMSALDELAVNRK